MSFILFISFLRNNWNLKSKWKYCILSVDKMSIYTIHMCLFLDPGMVYSILFVWDNRSRNAFSLVVFILFAVNSTCKQNSQSILYPKVLHSLRISHWLESIQTSQRIVINFGTGKIRKGKILNLALLTKYININLKPETTCKHYTLSRNTLVRLFL